MVLTKLRRGQVVWAELDPVRGREQAGRRPVLVVASDLFLVQANSLAIIVPVTTTDRGWPNHVPLAGPHGLDRTSFAMTEQVRTITRERVVSESGFVDEATMYSVDRWLRDFLSLS